ncbi:hypothetical protein P618_200517 [Holospora obtusa F1]|uniref:Thioredoxin domain-containing protein n=1 Tax=Holospora obtusa F1 TaxID=1399147 RepID=W6TH69_HOLOB|nr:hypothetical protein [Holospora obtusa]ETZ07285.1 hypothetical protein P618_200517 [Holospora obtusa F1]
MNKILSFFLLGMHSITVSAKIHPEEIVEMFEQYPEMFNILAQMSYHYGAEKKQETDSEEEILSKFLKNMNPDAIPGVSLTDFEERSNPENFVVAFVSPYCTHCRELIKNLIQLKKENFFEDHTKVQIVCAPTNLAAYCATKALIAAHKIKKTKGLKKYWELLTHDLTL